MVSRANLTGYSWCPILENGETMNIEVRRKETHSSSMHVFWKFKILKLFLETINKTHAKRIEEKDGKVYTLTKNSLVFGFFLFSLQYLSIFQRGLHSNGKEASQNSRLKSSTRENVLYYENDVIWEFDRRKIL